MASSATINAQVAALINKAYPSAEASSSSDPVKLSSAIFPAVQYTDAEKAEISQWTITAAHINADGEDAAKRAERLSQLNTHLATRTTVLGSKPSVADIALYSALAPVVSSWSPVERTGEQGHHHVVRHVDFVQGSPVFGLGIDEASRVAIDPGDVQFAIRPIDAKAEKERKKKEKEAAAAAAAADAGATETTLTGDAKKSKKDKAKEKAAGLADKVGAAVGMEVPLANADGGASAAAGPAAEGQQKEKGKFFRTEKKEKKPKPKAEPPKEKPLSPCLIDLRVGHIIKAERHPNADSLYVSRIACGDPEGTENTSEFEGRVVRTVCSGLNGLIPLEEMQDRKVVAVCNLKPVTMRGIKSCAMVLAATSRVPEGADPHSATVELVNPPEGANAGDRIEFEGWEGEPEGQLNPKKKVWETVQPGFTTTEDLEVAFDVGVVPQLAGEGDAKKEEIGKLKTAAGVCKVKSLKGAIVR